MSIAATLRAGFSDARMRGVDLRTVMLLGLALLLAMLDISQIIWALLGAAGYLLLQAMRPPIADTAAKRSSKAGKPGKGDAPIQVTLPDQHSQQAFFGAKSDNSPMRKSQVRTSSTARVTAPTFHAVGWEAEVQELARQLAPTAESDATCARIVRTVELALARTLPEAKISGFASCSLNSGSAFAVAVPDLEIVITMDPAVLDCRLQGKSRPSIVLDTKKLYKSTLRSVTDHLVGAGDFKFRRSAFRDEDPKVTLLVPAMHVGGSGDQAVPLSLSVNNATPLRGAALLAECDHREPRAKALILLVRRWARDRGLSHAAKGHLSPYTWTLLVIYFLQVGLSHGSLLPQLVDFAVYRQLGPSKKACDTSMTAPQATAALSSVSLGDLLKAFFHFFDGEFDWHREAVCPRSGRRAEPSSKLPLHIILKDDGSSTEVGPSIEDPFEKSTNCGSCMTAQSLMQLREEFQRANHLCAGNASLSVLLEPWAPPDANKGDQ